METKNTENTSEALKVQISEFASRLNPAASVREYTWGELCARLRTVRRTAETRAEWEAMPRGRRGAVKDVGGFTGGVFANGRRGNSSAVTRTLVTLDLDSGGEYDPEALIRQVAGTLRCAVCGYSTHSHTRRQPKIRLVIPLARPVEGEAYEAMTAALIRRCGLTEYADPSTVERGRLFYWCSASADAEVWTASVAGPPLVWNGGIPASAPGTAGANSKQAPGTVGANSKQGAGMPPLHNSDPRERDGIIGAFNRVYFPIQKAIDRYLGGVYERHGEGRYTFRGANSAGGLTILDGGLRAFSHHSNKDPAARGRHSHDAWGLVAVSLFGEGQERGPAMLRLAMDDPEVMAETCAVFDGIAEQEGAADAGPDPAADPAKGRKRADALVLDRLRDGRPQSHGFNAKILIGEDPLLKGNISYNLFSENAEAHPGLPWFGLTHPGAGDAQPWNDADLSALCNYLAEFYRFKGKDAVCDALDEVSRRRQRHPVRQWLASLRWDGVPRLETAIIRLLGARDDAATREITKLWFCGAVARVMQPGCKFDYMLILKGPQGCYKSTFFGTMFHPWFSDSLDITDDKDTRQHLSGVWGLELGELAGLKKASVEVIKRFITQQQDRYRASYGRNMETHLRQCVFAGTTNSEYFLVDKENRRFLVVTIEPELRAGDDPARDIAAEKEQLWAEAYHLYNTEYKGRGLTLSRSSYAEQTARNAEVNLDRIDPLRQALQDYISRPLPRKWDSYTIAERRVYYRSADLSEMDESQLMPRTFFSIHEMCTEFWELKSPSEARARLGKMCGSDWQKTLIKYLRELGDWKCKGQVRLKHSKVRVKRYELQSDI